MCKHNNNFTQTKFILAFLVAGLIFPGCSSGTTGYTVKVTKAVVIPGAKEKYTFKYYLNGSLNSGFVCNCQYVGVATQWVGSGSDGCSGVTAADKAIPVSGLSVTTGACCIAQPTVDASLPQPPVNPGSSCW